MAESLRRRLLGWFAAILGLVIAGYGGAVCWLFWSSLVGEVDAELQRHAAVMTVAVRPVGPGLYDIEIPAGAAASLDRVDERQIHYAIWDAAGGALDGTAPLAELGAMPDLGPGTRDGRRELVVEGPGGARVLVAQDLSPVRREVLSLVWVLAGAGLVAMLISLAGGRFLANHALAPVKRIALTAGEMLRGHFSARIPVEQTESELGQLALALNAAFDRLQQAIEKERQFTADASHELRTPLATLSAEVEWALGRERTVAEYRRALGTCEAAIVRMTALTERLLALARADAGQFQQMVPVHLDEVVEEAVRLLSPTAAPRGIAIEADLDRAAVTGDRDRLSELVINLVANAVQYSHDGGRVDVTLANDPVARGVCLRVADTGIGIRPEELPRVFDRFYRAESTRTRRTGGAGLGLAVAKSIAEAHHGAITGRSDPAQGTVFEVRLPTSEAVGPSKSGG